MHEAGRDLESGHVALMEAVSVKHPVFVSQANPGFHSCGRVSTSWLIDIHGTAALFPLLDGLLLTSA